MYVNEFFFHYCALLMYSNNYNMLESQSAELKIHLKKKRLMHFKKRHTESHMTIPWTFNAYCPMFILAVHHTWVKDVYFE